MFKHELFWVQGAVLAVVATLHAMGVHLALYWTWKPYDIPVHFLGGAWVALFALWLVFFSPLKRAPRVKYPMLFVAVIATATAGLGWEVFEYLVKVPTEEAYLFDTRMDLTMDMVGALAAWLFVKKRYGA